MVVPNGRHGTAKRPTGRALGRRPGTSTVQARPDRHGGPLRHDTVPGRHGTMAMYTRTLACKPRILFFLYFNPRRKHVLFMSVYCMYILVCNTCIIILGQEQLPSLISNTNAICEIRFFHHTSWRDANLIYLTCCVCQWLVDTYCVGCLTLS